MAMGPGTSSHWTNTDGPSSHRTEVSSHNPPRLPAARHCSAVGCRSADGSRSASGSGPPGRPRRPQPSRKRTSGAARPATAAQRRRRAGTRQSRRPPPTAPTPARAAPAKCAPTSPGRPEGKPATAKGTAPVAVSQSARHDNPDATPCCDGRQRRTAKQRRGTLRGRRPSAEDFPPHHALATVTTLEGLFVSRSPNGE